MRWLLLVLVLFLLLPLPAQAQSLESCGAPDSYSVDSDIPRQLCDLYQRRFAYRQERMNLRADIDVRREVYIAPRIEAVKAYERDLKALHSIVE